MKKKHIFTLIMMIILMLPSIIFAFADELIDNPKPWVPEDIATMSNTILGAIQWAGYAIAVGMLLYVAIKYMLSAANEKANLKQLLINYLIGAAIVFGVTTIFTGIVGFFTGEGATNVGGGDITISRDCEDEHMWKDTGIVIHPTTGEVNNSYICGACGAKMLSRISNTDEVESGEVESGEIESGEIESGEVESGEVESGEVESGEVDSDEVGLEEGGSEEKVYVHNEVDSIGANGCSGRMKREVIRTTLGNRIANLQV